MGPRFDCKKRRASRFSSVVVSLCDLRPLKRHFVLYLPRRQLPVYMYAALQDSIGHGVMFINDNFRGLQLVAGRKQKMIGGLFPRT